MSAARRWVLASGNRGKLAEIVALLRDSELADVQLVAQSELNITSPLETASTFVENALIKARHAARLAGLPAVADDSGIAVDALGGAPGVLSARFAGPSADDRANVRKLLESLVDVPSGERRASFHCVMVALNGENDPAPIIASGHWRGEIAFRPAGSSGFGYDPIFFDPALGRTAAELAPAVKNRVSHRGQALRRLAEALQSSGL
ncbi:MAG TPA: RdgB/HAM1 family non-canonical purine NTP pyrophosphatase [Gammaproteobacteria bacterium]|nr:RdgB/HAM1 family non-canonical purine NTP pyrophosphatase [Gammaproteobacteria bacterium]